MSFEKLHVYQAAVKLSAGVNALTKGVRGEFIDETRNLRECAASCHENIAEAVGVNREGHGRMIVHLEIARGSADETRAALSKLSKEGVFSPKASAPLEILARTVAKMLTSLIKKLQKASK